MPGIPKLSLVEGAFEELSQELATYIDTLKGEGSSAASEVAPLLADPEKEGSQTDKDAVLKKLVSEAKVLNTAPERELQAAYNLVIHLIAQVEEPDRYIQRLCQYLTAPITSSQQNGTGIALGVLGTVFNTIEPDDDTRYHVLLAIVEVVKKSSNFETLEPQLKDLDGWLESWEMTPEEQRKLFLAISETATAPNEREQRYTYLLKALRTLQSKSDASSSEAQKLSIDVLKAGLQNEKHFDFQDLTALDSVQALRKSDQTWFELLELFSAQNFDDLDDFKEANGSFLSDNGLDEDLLDRKMRLLTLASLAAIASNTRTLPYSQISKALQILAADVEMWVIDCIRSGLVEGKLSQAKQEFLVHRSTYRVFGDNQWREVASRLETWKSSLVNVLAVIRSQKEEFVREKESELNGVQNNQGYRPDRRQRNALPVDVLD